MEETTAGALIVGILGLLGKEVVAYLRGRQAADVARQAALPDGQKPSTGNPHPANGQAQKLLLERALARLDEQIDILKHNRKDLAAIAESTEKMMRIVTRFEETQGRIERAHRERLRQAAEGE
jgi:hypothetical protein